MTEETDGTIAGTEATAAAETSQVETPSEATTEQSTGTEQAGQADDTGAEPKPKQVPWFQKRIDEVTAKKYEAEREAAYWRGVAESKRPETAKPEPAILPTLEQFNYDEAAYQAALTKHITEQTEKSLDERLTTRERQAAETQKNTTALTKLQTDGAKHPDFVAAVSHLPANEAIRDFVLDEPNAANVLYELGKDSEASARFLSLPPHLQALELGRRAARQSGSQATARTIPPPPPQTVSGMASAMAKTPEQMSMAEYAAWVKERDKT